MKYLTISGLSRFLNNLKKLIPSKTSQLTNDSGYITADQVSNVTGYSKTEVDYLINQADSNVVHLTGNETIGGTKTFTSFPTLYYGAGDNYLSFLKSSSLIFGTAPQNTQTYSIRCLDKNDIIISEFSSQAQANGINNLSLRVRNTDGTNIYDRRINFNINTSGLTYFAPNIDNICSLGVADHQWKSVYAQSYYLGSTAFGDIVTHNASEFLTSHQSLSNYVTLDGAQTISGNKTFTGSVDTHNLTPETDNTYSLGTTSKRWTDLYASKNISIYEHGLTFGTTPATSAYFGFRYYDNAGNVYGDLLFNSNSNGSNYLRLRCRNTNGTDTYDRQVQLFVKTDGTTQFLPNNSDTTELGTSSNQWKSVYSNAYYLGTTAFGDIVTHNANEFLTSHQSLSNYSTLANTVKSLSISGKTITVTPGSGSAYTLTTQDTVYTHPTTAGNKHVPSGGSSGQFLGWDSDGTAKWVNNPNSDTKNTAGSTDTSSKIFLIGATSQAANPQTYSHDTAYVGTDGCLYSNGTKVLTAHQSLSNYSTLANTVKSLSISGKTITVTPGSGSAYTLTTQDTVYTHPTTAGNKHIPSGGSANQYLKYSASGTAVWADLPTIPTKTSQLTNDSGFLTAHQSLSNYLTKTTNVSEMGRYIDLHYDNATAAYDYDARIYVNSQGTAKGGGALAIAAASVTAPNLTVTNNASNGIKFGSYTVYVG